MQAMFSRELADQRIAEYRQQATRDRLARQARQAKRAAARQALRELLRRPAAQGAETAGVDATRGA